MILRNGKITSYTDTVESVVKAAAEIAKTRAGHIHVISEDTGTEIRGYAAGREIYTQSPAVADAAKSLGYEVAEDVPFAGDYELILR